MHQVNYKQVVIMSAHRSKIDPVANHAASMELEKHVKVLGLVPHEAIGVYKGKPEVSYVIPVSTNEEILNLKWLAFMILKQDSVLYQDDRGHAWLCYHNKTKELIGNLRATTKKQALAQGDYTLFNDVYYTVGA